jgi:hypothetical protein
MAPPLKKVNLIKGVNIDLSAQWRRTESGQTGGGT